MPNVLTGLTVTLFNALDVVSRELVGFIPAVQSDMTYERAAVGQVVTSPVTPVAAATNITPGVTPPNDGDQTIGAVSMTITKARRVPIRWNGEEKKGLDNNGASYNTILRDQFTQAMRALVNEIETDLGNLAAVSGSRAYGTPGTTPFTTTVGDSAQLLKILKDNGASMTDLQMVLDTTAGATMRSLPNLTKVNEGGDNSLLRRGVLLDLHGFAIRESAGVQTPANGTSAAYTTNTAGYATGATVITLITGTGTVLAGDIVSFAGDANKYVVAVGTAAPGTITLSAPGLRKAIPAAATNMTTSAISTRNVGFARTAMALATRAPALPPQGDIAADRTVITDPLSGLSFEIAAYPQYRQMQFEVSIAWGVAAIKREHIAVLQG